MTTTYTVVASSRGDMVQVHKAGCGAAARTGRTAQVVTGWTVQGSLEDVIAEVLDTCENLTVADIKVHACCKR